jgi:hypothetical protein
VVCSRSGGQQQRARCDACLSHRIRARCPAASRTTSASAKPDVRSPPNCPIAPLLLPPCPTCAYDVAARCSLKVDRFATATHAAGGRPRAHREVATRRSTRRWGQAARLPVCRWGLAMCLPAHPHPHRRGLPRATLHARRWGRPDATSHARPPRATGCRPYLAD